MSTSQSRLRSLLATAVHTAREKRYRMQRLVPVRSGQFEILAPSGHTLVRHGPQQPLRNRFVGISAGAMSAKYPKASLIDIGANIGDTAAMMASHSSAEIWLIEPDSYFASILERNRVRLPNKSHVVRALVSDGASVAGGFRHWGGTAQFLEVDVQDSPAQGVQRSTTRLADIAGEQVCFVKIDTDGYDYKIILSSMDWLATVRPAVLFESEIRTAQDRSDADEACVQLAGIGYSHFMLWDDAGFHVLSTTDLEAMRDLHHYLWKIWDAGGGAKPIYAFNVLALHGQDADVCAQVGEWYKRN